MRLSVIVPTYNEAPTILQILEKIDNLELPEVDIEVIVIDDGSTDGTMELLSRNAHLYSRLIQNEKNLGKGGAVKRGLEAATGAYVLFQDADLEYDPVEYAGLLDPVIRFEADVVMGSRFLAPSWTRVFYFWHRLGNGLITLWFNMLHNTTWTDVYSCYLMFRRDLIESTDLRTVGWEQHAEILGKVCARGSKLYEVPINYNGRSYDEGKKIRWYHTLGVLLTMLRVRITRDV